ncbi:MAG: Glycine-zipper containing OmpA-like membrane domain-containing protein [Candidatus Nitrotoga sp. SPKER]|nr:MAG: Glycine-zipper containing OmpA-like membrane domain-containing protein [Candidatus Nitrotoga sp. SPKER]
MTHKLRNSLVLLSILELSACTSIPTGPGMLALPGTGKSFNQFRFDESDCRRYASAQIDGRTANEAAADSGVKSAVVGTAVGATAGALLGGHNGAGVGAGSGLLIGSMAGAGASESSGYNLQQRYDFAYLQCMYAKGHRVPVLGTLEGSRQPVQNSKNVPLPVPSGASSSSSTSSFVPPPPPRGKPPPPPPDVVTAPLTSEDIEQLVPRENVLPLTTPDDTSPLMPAEDVQPPMPPSGNPPPPPPDV